MRKLNQFFGVALAALQLLAAATAKADCTPGTDDHRGAVCGHLPGSQGHEHVRNYASCTALHEAHATFAQFGNCELERTYSLQLTFESYSDCEAKWSQQLAISGAEAKLAGFATNEKAHVVCRRLFPYYYQ